MNIAEGVFTGGSVFAGGFIPFFNHIIIMLISQCIQRKPYIPESLPDRPVRR